MDVVKLNRRAVSVSADIVAAFGDDALAAPTPCAQWDVRRLLAHMTAQHNGFAAAARGAGSDDAVWAEEPLDDPRDAYGASAQRVLAAFDEPGVLDRMFVLPEIRRDSGFPGRMAIAFHLLDYLVHGWDVGAAVGAPPAFDDELVAAGLEVTRRFVPDGPARSLPGAAFAPPVPPVAGWSDQERLLALLGRSPSWPN
ncbi:TIGR03086 family metal-binding protein [Solwaraspora sp. WMMD406]|uniref:TIGR03086 family metal-binding protein n=1 Tax=Solwaraspora sp. WMMD406 TaxID=3016095 RepID=UPI002418127B|nr:TIGR03086 family metal-binding protein [Solwaraspora sp. WMMD406]MDG4765025.1 TIGR03086 family metal-binding protein [Solwaraspora sp. WMMD406]